MGSGHIQVEFHRSLNQQEFREWERLVELLTSVSLGEGRDIMCWALEKSGKYSTRSFYKAITFGGVENKFLMGIWKTRIPLKIQIFLWMVYHDRIQAVVQLKKRNWDGAVECKLCGEIETSDHILFQCPVALFLWVFLKQTFGWAAYPSSFGALMENLLLNNKGRVRHLYLFLCAGALWTLWKTRNDLVFNAKIVPAPVVVIHKTIALLTQWKILLKKKDRAKMELMIGEMSASALSV